MFCAYTRPRFQVSVDRTIGPLVFILAGDKDSHKSLDAFEFSVRSHYRCDHSSSFRGARWLSGRVLDCGAKSLGVRSLPLP